MIKRISNKELLHITLALILVLFITPFTLSGQDSIQVEDIAQFSHEFNIVDGKFVGPGAKVISEAIANSHVVMLGNNSRNQNEWELDIALAKILNENEYNTLIMEVGPASANVINDKIGETASIVNTFKDLNKNYFFEANELLFMSIPDFKYLGASKLLEYTEERDWSFSGIGVDSWTGYKLFLDQMFDNLSKEQKNTNQKDYQNSRNLLDSLYSKINGQNYDDILMLTSGIKSSESFSSFLQNMDAVDSNKELVKYVEFSINYWWLYGNKDGFQKNKLSNLRNKVLMKHYLDEIEFDFEEDKMLLKMWRGHLVNGVTRNGFYGIGNTMMELANYHGHNSLNIGVFGRYIMREGQLIDPLDNPDNILPLRKMMLSLGQKEEWILIDLRPFTKTFYWGSYVRSIELLNMMRQYDMIIIPKTDKKGQINH